MADTSATRHDRDDSPTDICLVVPPFDAIIFPALGTSVLASALKARGLKTRIVYGSILLAARVGANPYRFICNSSQRQLAGEKLFAAHAYGPEERAAMGLSEPRARSAQIGKVAAAIAPFLDTLVRQILASKPRIVGITTNFQQNMAAIAIARRIKARAPQTCVVLGGANVASPMGDGLAKVYPWIDHFFSGEADIAFPDFCERLVREGVRPEQKLIHCPPIEDMRVVHAPDFSDYFAAIAHYQKRGRLPPELPEFITMETSRGCWWGEMHHCTFCGLNGEGMGFRKKAADTAYAEMRALTERWKVGKIHVADNIMPLNFLDDLLPRLAEWPEHPKLFFEVKANLRDEQLDTMARGGVDSIQPGIESLSSNVLKIMRKGVSALQNVSLLRACRTRGIHVLWNLLYGFPGERIEDYEATLALMPKLHHLRPPAGVAQIVIDRFSPYHMTPDALGIGAIAPFPAYASLYPADAPLADIAYHFQGDYSTPLLADEALLAALRAGAETWKRLWHADKIPVLRAIAVAPGKAVIQDTRSLAQRPLTPVSQEMLAALAYFEKPRPRGGSHGAHEGAIDELLAQHFLIEHEKALLSVVTANTAAQQMAAEKPAARRAAS